MVNLLVIDSYAVYRYGLTSMLKEQPEFRVIGDATNTSEAVAKLGELQPDIVIMDIFMPGGEAVEAINLMRQKFLNSPQVSSPLHKLGGKKVSEAMGMKSI